MAGGKVNCRLQEVKQQKFSRQFGNSQLTIASPPRRTVLFAVAPEAMYAGVSATGKL